MAAQNIVTGHEVEMAELARQVTTPEYRALVIKLAGEGLADAGETLRLAALGQLPVIEKNIFGESESVEQQVAMAELQIERHMASLAPIKTGVEAMDRFLNSGGTDVGGFSK